MTFELAKAHLSQNSTMSHAEVPEFLRSLHATMAALADSAGKNRRNTVPAASPNQIKGIGHRAEELASASANTSVGTPGSPALVAVVRQTDISAPEFSGLDSWLAERIPPGVAAKLNRDSSTHPTVFPNELICLEDGAATKMLRVYVERRFGLTFEQYLQKWRLPDDYPPNPPSYTQKKRAQAKEHGFGVLTRGHKGRKAAPQEAASTQRDQPSSKQATAQGRGTSSRNSKTKTERAQNEGPEKSRRRRKLSLFAEAEQHHGGSNSE